MGMISMKKVRSYAKPKVKPIMMGIGFLYPQQCCKTEFSISEKKRIIESMGPYWATYCACYVPRSPGFWSALRAGEPSFFSVCAQKMGATWVVEWAKACRFTDFPPVLLGINNTPRSSTAHFSGKAFGHNFLLPAHTWLWGPPTYDVILLFHHMCNRPWKYAYHF